MRRFLWLLTTLAMLLAAPAAALASAGGEVPRLTAFEGAVTVADAAGVASEPQADMPLYNGYTVATGEDGEAELHLDGTKTVRLGGSGRVELRRSGGRTEVLLRSGELFFRADEPLAADELFTLRTADVTAEVRGGFGWLAQGRAGLLEGRAALVCEDPATGWTLEAELGAGELAALGADGYAVRAMEAGDVPLLATERLAQSEELRARAEAATGLALGPLLEGLEETRAAALAARQEALAAVEEALAAQRDALAERETTSYYVLGQATPTPSPEPTQTPVQTPDPSQMLAPGSTVPPDATEMPTATWRHQGTATSRPITVTPAPTRGPSTTNPPRPTWPVTPSPTAASTPVPTSSAALTPVPTPTASPSPHEPTFTVTLLDEDGRTVLGTLRAGQGRTLPQPELGRVGYGLVWYADAARTTPWRFDSDAVTGDMTLYAGWTALAGLIREGVTGEAGLVTAGEPVTLGDGVYYLSADVTASGVFDALITIPEGAEVTLYLNGHTIDADGRGRALSVAGALMLADAYGEAPSDDAPAGRLTGGEAETGAGVYISGEGSVVMTGGVISGNRAVQAGGGVYVGGEGAFGMAGGTVTGNEAAFYGGGVYVASRALIVVTGAARIDGNTAAGAANNLYLPGGKLLGVVGTMEPDASVGVTMARPGVFTDGLEGADPTGVFRSDDPGYVVRLSEDGREAALARGEEVP